MNMASSPTHKWARSFSDKVRGLSCTSFEVILGVQRNRRIAGKQS